MLQVAESPHTSHQTAINYILKECILTNPLKTLRKITMLLHRDITVEEMPTRGYDCVLLSFFLPILALLLSFFAFDLQNTKPQ